MIASIPPEFSRNVAVARLTRRASVHRITADPIEREALARRFDLVSLDRLDAAISLSRAADGEIRLEGTLEAELVQSCVVTLDPVPAQLTDRFTIRYRADLDEEEADRLALEDPFDHLVEPLEGDAIDIGEAVAQQLAVAMDPYPRAPGVEAPEILSDDGHVADEPVGTALASLAALKQR